MLQKLFILFVASKIYCDFPGVEDDFLRCYTCINTTPANDQCPQDALKKQTCEGFAELLNQNVVEERPPTTITYKCTQIRYVGKQF